MNTGSLAERRCNRFLPGTSEVQLLGGPPAARNFPAGLTRPPAENRRALATNRSRGRVKEHVPLIHRGVAQPA
jgi:hypothetical protein